MNKLEVFSPKGKVNTCILVTVEERANNTRGADWSFQVAKWQEKVINESSSFLGVMGVMGETGKERPSLWIVRALSS